MSDYITLAELKGMTDLELHRRWSIADFPFDRANCGSCATLHGGQDEYYDCEHADYRRLAVPLWLKQDKLSSCIDEIYALRLYFRDLYPVNPPELDAIPIVEEVNQKC